INTAYSVLLNTTYRSSDTESEALKLELDFFIKVNGKNAYGLKGKFLDDLHNNAFSGTNGEDAVEHIEYFLRIVDRIDLPNVNQDKLRVVVFPISLVGDAWRCDEIDPTNEEPSNLEETNHNDEQEIGEIFRIETNMFDYETSMCEKFKEFNYLLKIDPDFLTKDIEGFKTYEDYKDDCIYEWNKDIQWDYKWYEALEDGELKQEALRNKGIMKGLINEDDESSDEDGESEEHKLCGNETRELPVCQIERYMMIKYSFGDDEKYIAIKKDEYDDFTSTSEEACRAYQEIFQMMDEGWMVTRDE
ncbi:hypothetical protein Tco_0551273, partial [Tanacetum coccineum]